MAHVATVPARSLLAWLGRPGSASSRRVHPGRRPVREWLLEPLEGRALLATIPVTTLADAGAGSLREAIGQANALAGPDTISFGPAVRGTIELLSALPELASDIVLEGPGAEALTVARSAAAGTPEFRIFTVPARAEVAISGLTLTGGLAGTGGGIANSGVLMVTASTLTGNSASGGGGSGGAGGGIFNSGALTVTASTLTGNSASGGGAGSGSSGGGIANFGGGVTVTTSILSGNSAGGGGGIDNNGGVVTVTASTLSGNSATVGGGINNFGGLVTVTASTLAGNSAAVGGAIANSVGTLTVIASTLAGNSGGEGGGIFNLGMSTVIASTLAGNSAVLGGAIANDGGTLTITASTLSGNSAGGGGGIANENSGTLTITSSTLSDNSAHFGGGGINNQATLTVTASTLSGNSAYDGGGIGNGNHPSATVTVTASTLSGNSARSSGGGIANFGGGVTVTASTLSGNSAADGGGGIANRFFGSPTTVAVLSSLFANGPGGNLANTDGSVASLGHNLFTDTPTVPLAPTDLVETDPLLAPLGDYGGPTATHALLPGSPAIDAGADVPGLTTDQRGVPRPQGPAPDIGAFESRGFVLSAVSGSGQQAEPGAPFAGPLVVAVTSAFGEPVAGGQVSFAAPTQDASALLVGTPATIGPDGRAAVTATADDIRGAYTVTAGAAGADAVAFALRNGAEPPTVVSLLRLGFHHRPARLVLAFSTPLDPARAQDPANYRLTAVGPHHARPIPLRAATYDAAGPTVTLLPARQLAPQGTYRLVVNTQPPGGLVSPSGVPLDGDGDGQPGGDFTAGFVGRPGPVHRRPAALLWPRAPWAALATRRVLS